ncbi:MAG: hypothetical protein V1770_01515 [bacterium]
MVRRKSRFIIYALLILLSSFSLPKISYAGFWDLFKFGKSSYEAIQEEQNIQNGVVSEDAQQWLESEGLEEGREAMLDPYFFPCQDEQMQKTLNAQFTSRYALEKIGKMAESGGDVVVSSYDLPYSQTISPSIEVAAETGKLKWIGRIKSFFGFIKDIFSSNKTENPQPALPSEPIKQQEKESPQTSEEKKIAETKETVVNKKPPVEPPKKAEEKPKQPASTPPATSLIENKTQAISNSILVTDQSNEPVERAKVWLEDDRGIIYPSDIFSYWNTDKTGKVYFSYTAKDKGIPDGDFTIHIEKQNYTSTKEKINMLDDSALQAVKISPNKFTLRKWGKITGLVITESGDVADGAGWKVTNNKGEYIGEFGNKEVESFSALPNGYTTSTGRLETFPVPDGKYTLHVSCGGRCGFDALYSKNIDVEVSGLEVWLDKIALQKEN